MLNWNNVEIIIAAFYTTSIVMMSACILLSTLTVIMNYSIIKARLIPCKCQYSVKHLQDIWLVLMSPSARYFYLFSCKHTYLTPDKVLHACCSHIFRPNSSMLHVSNIIHIWTDVCCTHAENPCSYIACMYLYAAYLCNLLCVQC